MQCWYLPAAKNLRWQECSHILVHARVGIQRHSGDLISELIERSRAAAAPPKTQTGLQNALFWALFSTEPWMQKRPKDWVLLYTGWQRWSELNNRLNCCIFIRVLESRLRSMQLQICFITARVLLVPTSDKIFLSFLPCIFSSNHIRLNKLCFSIIW